MAFCGFLSASALRRGMARRYGRYAKTGRRWRVPSTQRETAAAPSAAGRRQLVRATSLFVRCTLTLRAGEDWQHVPTVSRAEHGRWAHSRCERGGFLCRRAGRTRCILPNAAVAPSLRIFYLGSLWFRLLVICHTPGGENGGAALVAFSCMLSLRFYVSAAARHGAAAADSSARTCCGFYTRVRQNFSPAAAWRSTTRTPASLQRLRRRAAATPLCEHHG